MASLSGLALWSSNRDQIITRALRICGAYGTGETPAASEITEGAEALNDLVKELEADGMPLWKISTRGPFTYTATNSYLIGVGSTFNDFAPLKILQAWNHDITNSAQPIDSPMIIVTDQDYDYLGLKKTPGTPQQLRYTPPGPGTITVSDTVGTITVYPLPDSNAISNKQLQIVAHLPFEDFNASTDIPDFPQYWYNALKWLLAAELMYEKGVGLAERGMIQKMADNKKELALSFGTEEGSLYLRPTVQYVGPGGSTY